jgi:hypothetical protein
VRADPIIASKSAGDRNRDPVREMGLRKEPRMPKSWVRVCLPSQKKLKQLRKDTAVCFTNEKPTFDTKPKQRYLVLKCMAPIFGKEVLVLVDTGAVVNIFSEELAERIRDQVVRAKRLRNFKTADGSPLRGGSEEATLELHLPLKTLEGKDQERVISDTFYVGNITVDIIMSYECLARHQLAVVPHWDSLLHLPVNVPSSPKEQPCF